MEIKGKARFPARIKGRHLGNQRPQQRRGVSAEWSSTEATKDSFEEEQELRVWCETSDELMGYRKTACLLRSLSSEPSSNLFGKHLEGTNFTATFQ